MHGSHDERHRCILHAPVSKVATPYMTSEGRERIVKTYLNDMIDRLIDKIRLGKATHK